MKLNRTGSNWTELERNKINENWGIIEGNHNKLEGEFNDVIGKITDEVVGHLIDSAKLIWKEPVDTVADLPANAEVGETRMVREADPDGISYVYRYDGENWEKIQAIDVTLINEVDRRLSAQLAQIPQVGVNVLSFGAIGNRTNDDRKAIQDAIDYLESEGGGTLFFPFGYNFSIQSTHPEYPGCGLVIKESNIKLIGINHTRIWCDVEMDKLIYFPDPGFRQQDFDISGIRLEGNQLCNIGIYTENFIYRLLFEATYVHNFKEKGIDADIFTAKFDRCVFLKNSEVNIDLNALDMPGTSVTFISNNSTKSKVGYRLKYMNYTTFISSFAEEVDLGIDLERCNGISFQSCGSEHINQVIKAERCSGIEVGFWYSGELIYNDITPSNDFMFEFNNCIGGHFGGTNRQETLREGVGMVRFTDCRNMTFNHGAIIKKPERNQVVFVRSQVNILDKATGTTTAGIYYINPKTGSDYSLFENHGTTPETAFRSWWKVAEVLPRNIDHNVAVVLNGDLDEIIDLKGFKVSGSLQITGDGYNVKKIEARGCIGNISIFNLKAIEDSTIFNCQGVRMEECEFDELDVRWSSGIDVATTKVNELLRFRNASTGTIRNSSGVGGIDAFASLVFVEGSTPTGMRRPRDGGRIYEGSGS